MTYFIIAICVIAVPLGYGVWKTRHQVSTQMYEKAYYAFIELNKSYEIHVHEFGRALITVKGINEALPRDHDKIIKHIEWLFALKHSAKRHITDFKRFERRHHLVIKQYPDLFNTRQIYKTNSSLLLGVAGLLKDIGDLSLPNNVRAIN